MSRVAILAAIKAAGAKGDSKTMLRLYADNRISYDAAMKAYREGVKFAANVNESRVSLTRRRIV